MRWVAPQAVHWAKPVVGSISFIVVVAIVTLLSGERSGSCCLYYSEPLLAEWVRPVGAPSGPCGQGLFHAGRVGAEAQHVDRPPVVLGAVVALRQAAQGRWVFVEEVHRVLGELDGEVLGYVGSLATLDTGSSHEGPRPSAARGRAHAWASVVGAGSVHQTRTAPPRWLRRCRPSCLQH